MTFQLWETESANLVGSSPTETAALAIVREATETYGPDATATLLLIQEGPRGRLTKIAEGSALRDLALARATQWSSLTDGRSR